MDLELAERVCVVTGSTAGIGLETARLLAEEGATVVICGRDRGRLESARSESGAALAVPCDLATREGPAGVIASAEEAFGRVDCLVNNVGLAVQRSLEEVTDVGPVINDAAVERIASYAQVGRNEAELVIGGEPARDGKLAKGSFFQPTIFTEVKPDARIAQEEIFGPVTSIIPVDDWDETVRIVNSVKYGLSTSLFTNDINLAFRSIRDFESGLGYVNHGTIGAEAHLPFGGVKATGNGHREVGQAALDFFSEWKSVYIDYSGKLQRAQIDTTFVDQD